MSIVEGQMRATRFAGHMCKVRPHRDIARIIAKNSVICQNNTNNILEDAFDQVIDVSPQSDRAIEIRGQHKSECTSC